jgi:hypothetical protein
MLKVTNYEQPYYAVFYSPSPMSDFLLSALFSNTLTLYSFLIIRDQNAFGPVLGSTQPSIHRLPRVPSLRVNGQSVKLTTNLHLRGPFAKFLDWRQCATVMQRETVTVNAKL